MESNDLCNKWHEPIFDCLIDRKDFRYLKNGTDHFNASLFDTNSMKVAKLNQTDTPLSLLLIVNRKLFSFFTHVWRSVHSMILIPLNSISRNSPNSSLYSDMREWFIHAMSRLIELIFIWEKPSANNESMSSIKHKTIMVSYFAKCGLNPMWQVMADWLDCHFPVHKLKSKKKY